MKSTTSELAALPERAPMPRFTSIVIAFWAGSLWSICMLVAPTLFVLLEDRAVAGRLATHFFGLATLIGVISAALLLALSFARHAMPGRFTRTLVLLTAGLPLLSKLALGPLMDQARAAGDMARFGALHGVAAGLFFLACASALGMVWNFSQRSK